MDRFKQIYDEMSSRKDKPEDYGPYTGGNGRVDRAAKLLRLCAFPRGTLLDVGGAIGNLGYAVRDLYPWRYVMDISEVCRKPAESKGNKFICGNVDVEGLLFPDERSDGPVVDMIVALDFIEHIIDPEKFARECYRILKPGGYVLLNTPNIQYWRHLESLVVHGVFPHTSGDTEVYHGGHTAFYNLNDMQRIFGAFTDLTMHTEFLEADPPPPLWSQISKVGNVQLSYSDLVFSCRKP